MIKICFVCLGNICRSPMAEFVMKDLVKKAGRENDFYIVSKATHSDNIWNGSGAPIYRNAADCLRAHGVPFDDAKEATLLKLRDYLKSICAVLLHRLSHILLKSPHHHNFQVFHFEE